MSDDSKDLQFDRVESGSTGTGVVCTVCQSSITTEYYDINSRVVCENCRLTLEHAAEGARGIRPLVRAAFLGLGAAVVGAVIYYAVIAFAHLEIGLIAILCGYMVGWAVRRGSNGLGGRRFQILAIGLTYFSIALAYMPLAIQGAREQSRQQANVASGRQAGAAAPQPVSPEGPRTMNTAPSVPRLAVALAFVFGFTLALPILVIVGSLPSGLISAFIIVIGLRQAWHMTATANLTVFGPYRVGAEPAGSVPL